MKIQNWPIFFIKNKSVNYLEEDSLWRTIYLLKIQFKMTGDNPFAEEILYLPLIEQFLLHRQWILEDKDQIVDSLFLILFLLILIYLKLRTDQKIFTKKTLNTPQLEKVKIQEENQQFLNLNSHLSTHKRKKMNVMK